MYRRICTKTLVPGNYLHRSYLLSSEIKVAENTKSYSSMFKSIISVDSPEKLTLETIWRKTDII